MNQQIKPHPASFRDPSGFVYEKDGNIFRFVSATYKNNYQLLQSSGLASELIKKKLLLPFTELNENHTASDQWFTTLQPENLPFLSFAWEWSFNELKDAALVTLKICRRALAKGMQLKDATPFNIQFVNNKPVLIDTLSFEKYETGKPWVAYRQFCECFLNPLLLAAHCHLEINKLFLSYPDGVPVNVTADLLPFKTKLNPAVYLHVFLHVNAYKKAAAHPAKKGVALSQKKLEQILQSLEDCISNLELKTIKTTWNNYYNETILSSEYLVAKKQLISSWLEEVSYATLLDAGANEGEFSLLAKKDAFIVAADFDSSCINNLYLKVKKEKLTHILPLVVDLSYPSPAIGWVNAERPALLQRLQFDLCFALALVHHLAIGKNVPLQHIALLFALVTNNYLIVEFVPKTDPKVKEMMQWREDIFEHYTLQNFEQAFLQYFRVMKKEQVPASERILYLCQKLS
jgi:hypothetical protein